MTSPWLEKTQDVDYKALTLMRLLDTWKAHRNDMTGHVCADEVCRRLAGIESTGETSAADAIAAMSAN